MRTSLLGVATLLASAVAVPSGLAADAPGSAGTPTTVKVALLDMSATMGMMGHGRMMGPGMMMEPGMMMDHGRMMDGPMMRNWWGQGQTQDGAAGPGMMGPGMMGRMMGMMSIQADRDTVQAGPVNFDVTNWSQGMVHELVVVAVDTPAALLPYDYAQARVVEDQVRVLGETEELQPNGSGGLDLTLSPGTYLLICNIPGHYASGMAIPLSVTS
jgi:uncharacterized cupredoxin-like copper-binding protein